MRLARQHPLQVPTRSNNGKFLVGLNGGQDVVHQQPSPPQQPAGDENSAVVPPSCVFPSCESVPTDLHGGPTILGDRFLLLGPAEGSALYRCVDVHNGQQLVAKVSERFLSQIVGSNLNKQACQSRLSTRKSLTKNLQTFRYYQFN